MTAYQGTVGLTALFTHTYNMELCWDCYILYSTWPKVCGHLLVEHLIPKSWALILSLSPPFAAITSSTLLRRRSTRCWNIAAGTCILFNSATKASVRSATVRFAVGVSIHSKDVRWVEVRALCRQVKFFHTNLDKPFLYGPRCKHGCIFMLNQERSFPKVLPQSWKHSFV